MPILPAQEDDLPTTSIQFLGLMLDSLAMEMCLPQEKLTYLHGILCDWLVHKQCNLQELQELIGFLQFCAQVIPHSCSFICSLINFSMTFNGNFMQRHILAYACSDILWWLAYAESWNGIQILEAPCATLHIYMDASGNKGLGWLGFSYSSWLNSAHNLFADTTSHFEYNQLFSITPSLKIKPCPQHPHLVVSHMLTCPPVLLFFFVAWPHHLDLSDL